MFREQQTYRAIAFRTPKLDGVDGLLGLFPAAFVEPAEEALPTEEKLAVLHCHYYSPQAWAQLYARAQARNEVNRLPRECRKRIGGKTCFRYNMYLMQTDPHGMSIFFVAVPFLGMALEVYPEVREHGRGQQFAYQLIDLEGLLAAVAADHNRGGSVVVRGVTFNVGGDDMSDALALRGQNVPGSKVAKVIAGPLARKGIRLTPEQTRLAVSIPGRSLVLELDSAGHYKFWVSRGASNLASMADLMAYFDGEGLLKQSLSFPLLRFLRAEAQEARSGESIER